MQHSIDQASLLQEILMVPAAQGIKQRFSSIDVAGVCKNCGSKCKSYAGACKSCSGLCKSGTCLSRYTHIENELFDAEFN